MARKETEYLTTMEFLRKVRSRCGYKLVAKSTKYTNGTAVVEYTLIDARDEYSCEEIVFTDQDEPKDQEMFNAQKTLNRADLEDDCDMDDETRRYKEYLDLYYIYMGTPIRKRDNEEAELMKLYYVVKKDSFDPLSMSMEFIIGGRESSCFRLGLLDRERAGDEEPLFYYKEHDGYACTIPCIIPEIELPFLPFNKDDLLLFEVFDEHDFRYAHESYCTALG